MRGLIIIAVMLAPLAFAHAAISKKTSAPDAPAAIEQSDSVRQAIIAARYRLQEDDLAGAAGILGKAIDSASFAQTEESVRYVALWMAGAIALQRGQPEVAHPLLVRATESPKAESESWHRRLSAAYATENYDDGAHCVATIAERWPKTLGDIYDNAIYRISMKVGEKPAMLPLQMRLLDALFKAHWRDEDGEPSALWRDLARLLLKNDVRAAAAVAARVQAPRVALSMCVDKSFDRITRRDESICDIDRMAAKAIDDARAKVQAEPAKLHSVVILQSRLIDLMKLEEAIALGDEVIAKVKDKTGSTVYTDFDAEYVWILDQRAQALARLGRWDDALTQRQRAARRPEQGAMNVSQVINLGELYAELGRPNDTNEAVVEIGQASAYGRMQLEGVKLAAAVQRKDAGAIAKHLAVMREHRADAIGAWQSALQLVGDMHGAVDLLVERLQRDIWRSEALASMQDYADIPATPIMAESMTRWRAVIADPKVQAVLAKVGRIEHFNLAPMAF